MYAGLDIATNKATKDEQRGIHHHLLAIVAPHERLNVLDFQRMAIDAACYVMNLFVLMVRR